MLPPRPLAETPGVAPLLAGSVLACGGFGAQWGDGSTSRALGSHIALWLAEIPPSLSTLRNKKTQRLKNNTNKQENANNQT